MASTLKGFVHTHRISISSFLDWVGETPIVEPWQSTLRSRLLTIPRSRDLPVAAHENESKRLVLLVR